MDDSSMTPASLPQVGDLVLTPTGHSTTIDGFYLRSVSRGTVRWRPCLPDDPDLAVIDTRLAPYRPWQVAWRERPLDQVSRNCAYGWQDLVQRVATGSQGIAPAHEATLSMLFDDMTAHERIAIEGWRQGVLRDISAHLAVTATQ
jgi:hypothetical protein